MKHKNQFIFLFTIIVIVLLNSLGLFEAINQKIYDNFILLNQEKKPNNKIVIIKIDSDSIRQTGEWPWSRAIYTEVLSDIIKAKPAVIGIALSFSEHKDLEEDKAFYKTLKSFPGTVLAAKYKYIKVKGKELYAPQFTIFPDLIHAHAGIKYSEKSIIRDFPLFINYPSFALQVLKLYYSDKPEQQKNLPERLLNWFNQIDNPSTRTKESILIDYKRPPDQFKQFSFIDVLNKKVNYTEFTGKIVLIGLTDISRTSTCTTPFTGVNSTPATPVELQAQIIDSLMNYRSLRKLPFLGEYIYPLLFALLFYFLTKDKRVLVQGICFAILIFSIGIFDYILFKYAAIWYAPALTFILLICTFGFSIYFTTSKIDTQLIKTINKFQEDKNIPLIEIPPEIESRVDALGTLVDIINDDRQTIKAIIDGVNNAMFVIEDSGKIIWANERALNIFKDFNILENFIQELITDIDLNELMFQVKENNIFKKEVAFDNLDFICIANPVPSKKNQYVVIFNDITELKEIDRLKTDMVRMVSHELKNPLMVIQICSENISFLKEKEKIDENNLKLFDASSLMLDTINNFLNLNKLESNLVDLQIKEEDMSELINKCISFQKTIASEKNITINLEESELPAVLMDINQITIVLNNLISNAIKYSHENGNINIKAETENDRVKISVIDQGIGIPAEEADRVFDKFFRSTNNKKNKIKGTGLGLSIVSKIISLHNGDISLYSEEGKGSCFYFSLPAAK